MPLPDVIRIGPYLFRREYQPQPRNDDGDADGLCLTETQVIVVKAGMTPQYERVVRLHEVLHAIWWERGLPDAAAEEVACEAISTALCAAYPDFEP